MALRFTLNGHTLARQRAGTFKQSATSRSLASLRTPPTGETRLFALM
jgi:hypothetical protein